VIARENPAHRGDGGGVRKGDHQGEIDSENKAHTSGRQPPRLDAMLKLFTLRAIDIFGNVIDGNATLIDSVDLLNDAAIASGLADRIGIDALQKLLTASFAAAAKEGEAS
jgi:hypothetical protein